MRANNCTDHFKRARTFTQEPRAYSGRTKLQLSAVKRAGIRAQSLEVGVQGGMPVTGCLGKQTGWGGGIYIHYTIYTFIHCIGMLTDAFTRASFVPAYSYWLPMNIFCVYIHVCCECIMIALYAYFFCPYLSCKSLQYTDCV